MLFGAPKRKRGGGFTCGKGNLRNNVHVMYLEKQRRRQNKGEVGK